MLQKSSVGDRKYQPVQVSNLLHLYSSRDRASLRRRITVDEIEFASSPRVGDHTSKEGDRGKERPICWSSYDVASDTRKHLLTTELEAVNELRQAQLHSPRIVERDPTCASIMYSGAISAVEDILKRSEAVGRHQRLEIGLVLERIDAGYP
jgi:hypothetical protein